MTSSSARVAFEAAIQKKINASDKLMAENHKNGENMEIKLFYINPSKRSF